MQSKGTHRDRILPLYNRMPVPIFDPINDMQVAKKYLQENGVVVVKLLTPQDCDNLIVAQYENTILKQPYLDEFKLQCPDPHTQRDAFLEWAKRDNLTPEELNARKHGWTNHFTFGACCDGSIFHNEHLWNLRSGPAADFAKFCIGNDREIWVDINRQIQKLPTAGEEEFLHWDMDPFSQDLLTQQHDNKINSLCGKVAFNNGTTFIGGLGTHLPSFFSEFQRQYAAIYPNTAGKKICKFGFDIKKPDPMNLFGNKRQNIPSDYMSCIPVPAGCAVFWLPEILHATEKNPRKNPTLYGCYLGYMPRNDRTEYKKKASQILTNYFKKEIEMPESKDRLRSYLQGSRPVCWPSLDPTHFAPAKSVNFPQQVRNKLKRYDPYLSQAITKWRDVRGVPQPYLHDDWAPTPGYKPPPLDDRGWRLLIHGF